MSLAVASHDDPATERELPSYIERARQILQRHPELFTRVGRGGGFSTRRREPKVQAASRRAPRVSGRRRGGRQLALPLAAQAPGMLH